MVEFLTLGFTLNEKTLVKDIKVPPKVSLSKTSLKSRPNSTIDNFFETLDNSVQQSIEPNMGLALSGGLDSRIIAGLAAKYDKNIIAFTHGYSNMEKKIAAKVCSVLKLRHFIINDSLIFNEQSIKKVKENIRKTYGIMNIFQIQVRTIISKYLNELGINKYLSGNLFDEVNGSTTAPQIRSNESFCRLLVQKSHPILPRKYRELTFQNLIESCKDVPFKDLFPFILAKNLVKQHSMREWIPSSTPIMNIEVLSVLTSLPYRKRISKRLQRKILKTYFPKLYRIPYATSLLPPSLPFIVHAGIQKVIKKLYAYTCNKPYPLLTYDYGFFMRKNIHFLKILLERPPPLINSQNIKNLIQNLNIPNALFLSRLSSYAVVREELAV